MIFLFSFFPDSEAQTLLQQSITYHDPDGQWAGFQQILLFQESRPNGNTREVSVLMDLPGQKFHYQMTDGDLKLERKLDQDQCSASLNGSSDISPEDLKKHRLSCEDIKFYRNYYQYLWGLPMKLRDPGTQLDPEVATASFQGKEVQVLKVTYAAEVGSDQWLFFLDPQTHALVGYQFFKPNGNGEYITLEGEFNLGNMRLPKARSWFVNKDQSLLGTDMLVGNISQ